MRKFKYLFSNKVKKKLLKKRKNLLDDEARHGYKVNSLFTKAFCLLYWTLMAFFLVTMIFLKQKIEAIIGKTFYVIFVSLGSFILPALILFYPFVKIEKKYPHQSLGNITRDIIAQCNSSLLRFYKIPEDYITTKCYDSSNPLLVDKDLILFFYKDRLRIVNDFTTTIKDFGCYEFKIDEIELFYEQRDNLMTTVIKSKKLTLSLGKRAKPFISKR